MRTNHHHIWFPRRDYTKPTERDFRQLPCNIIIIDEKLHNLLHAMTKYPPAKPSIEDMRLAIERHNEHTCGCYPDSPRRRGW